MLKAVWLVVAVGIILVSGNYLIGKANMIASLLTTIDDKDDIIVYFGYGERNIDSGYTSTIDTSLGKLVGTGKTIKCEGDLKRYNGIDFLFCTFNIRFFKGYTVIGDYQYDDVCYGTWSGRLSTTCALPSGVTADKWASYVVRLSSPSEFIVTGAVEDEKGNRINGQEVNLYYTDVNVQEVFVGKTVTSQSTNLQDGIFEFRVSSDLIPQKFFLYVAKDGYFTSRSEFYVASFQNDFLIKLELDVVPCNGDIIYGWDGQKYGTYCCVNGKVVIPPLYDNQIGYNGQSCGDVTPIEICGNGLDDNMNGQIDENCPVKPPWWKAYLPFALIGMGILLFFPPARVLLRRVIPI